MFCVVAEGGGGGGGGGGRVQCRMGKQVEQEPHRKMWETSRLSHFVLYTESCKVLVLVSAIFVQGYVE